MNQSTTLRLPALFWSRTRLSARSVEPFHPPLAVIQVNIAGIVGSGPSPGSQIPPPWLFGVVLHAEV